MLTNVRMPEQNYGDLKAQIAAMNTGERKVHDMVRKFGVEVFRQGVKDLLDLGERQARALLQPHPGRRLFLRRLPRRGRAGRRARAGSP